MYKKIIHSNSERKKKTIIRHWLTCVRVKLLNIFCEEITLLVSILSLCLLLLLYFFTCMSVFIILCDVFVSYAVSQLSEGNVPLYVICK
ncbi:hypothetical protein MATL_G00087150, partial [Megalops atlanticus]